MNEQTRLAHVTGRADSTFQGVPIAQVRSGGGSRRRWDALRLPVTERTVYIPVKENVRRGRGEVTSLLTSATHPAARAGSPAYRGTASHASTGHAP